MKISIISILIILAMTNLTCSLGIADEIYKSRPNIPASSWEQKSEGVAVALTLTTNAETKGQKDILKIYITDTSTTPKGCIIDSNDSGFKLFTRNSEGAWKPLRNYEASDIIMARSDIINPGETISHNIELNSEEMTLIKSRPVKCRILLFDRITKQKYFIESAPTQLTEIVLPAPNK